VAHCLQNGAGGSGAGAVVATVPAKEGDQFRAASVFNFELPTDPSFVPSASDWEPSLTAGPSALR